MLKTREVDIIEISKDQIKEVPEFKVYEKMGTAVIGLYVNHQWDTTTYLSNEKFREALNLAINREEIRDFIFSGRAQISGSGPVYGSWAVGYKPVPLIPYDPERARQLVRETFPGETPLINIYSWPVGGVPELATVAEALSGYWEKIGVKTKIIPTEYSTYRDEKAKKSPKLRNSVGLQRLPNRIFWDGSYTTSKHSKGLLTEIHDGKLDAMIDALVSESNPAVIGQRQYDVAFYMREHYLQIPLMEYSTLLAADPKKVPQWPHVSIPSASDYYLEDLYAR